MYRIGIAGSYGGCNLGDEAILSGILKEIRSSVDAEVTVFTGDTDHTLRHHRVERAVRCLGLNRDQLLAHLQGLDLFVLGGGGILFDRWVTDHIREPLLAIEHGIPVMVYAVGAGPLEDVETQRLVRECMERAAYVTVRDPDTRRLLERIGVSHEIRVTADPALLLDPEPLTEGTLEREGLAGKPRLIGMSVREPGPAAPGIDVTSYHAQLANAADYMIERYDADIVMVPLEPAVRDLQHAHAVISYMHEPQRASVLRLEYSPRQLVSLVSSFEFCVGMRLHFLIFSALAGVPFVALPYASKVSGFIEQLDMETPPMQELTVGQLIARIDRCWDERLELKARMARALPVVQEASRDNWRLALGLLESRRPAGEPLGMATMRSEG